MRVRARGSREVWIDNKNENCGVFSRMPCCQKHIKGYLYSETMYIKFKKAVIDTNVKAYMGIMNTNSGYGYS